MSHDYTPHSELVEDAVEVTLHRYPKLPKKLIKRTVTTALAIMQQQASMALANGGTYTVGGFFTLVRNHNENLVQTTTVRISSKWIKRTPGTMPPKLKLPKDLVSETQMLLKAKGYELAYEEVKFIVKAFILSCRCQVETCKSDVRLNGLVRLHWVPRNARELKDLKTGEIVILPEGRTLRGVVARPVKVNANKIQMGLTI